MPGRGEFTAMRSISTEGPAGLHSCYNGHPTRRGLLGQHVRRVCVPLGVRSRLRDGSHCDRRRACAASRSCVGHWLPVSASSSWHRKAVETARPDLDRGRNPDAATFRRRRSSPSPSPASRDARTVSTRCETARDGC
jgi:hypothetical protein